MKSMFKTRRNKSPFNLEDNEKKRTPYFSKEHRTPFFNTTAASSTIQPKLTIGQPNDKYEQEADNVANTLVNNSSTKLNTKNAGVSSIQKEALATPQEDEKLGTAEQRVEKDKLVQEKPELQKNEEAEEESIQAMEEQEENVQAMGEKEEESIQKMEDQEESVQAMEEKTEEESVQKMEEQEENVQQQAEDAEEEPLQAKKETTTKTQPAKQLENKLKQKAGTGKKLPKPVQKELQATLGKNFDNVTIHTDDDAAKMNKQLGAQAFTHGEDIYFNTGKYNIDSANGKRLLVHEATHVVQQTGKK